jgi:diphthine synthase
MVTLYLVGLGLADEKDISVKGLEAIKKSKRIFLESYTSILTIPIEQLENFYEKKIEIAYRENCEGKLIDNLLREIS